MKESAISPQRTLGIIKPDAVEDRKIGRILAAIESDGLIIQAMKMVRLSRPQVEAFYAVHRDRPFFGELVQFMTRGPVVVFTLEGADAVARWRNLMGATDPAKAEKGTIRSFCGKNIGENAVHGSDSVETAKTEVSFFFPGMASG